MDSIQLISLRLHELRQIHGLTQEETAALVGISTRFYQTLESGHKKQIWMATVEKLAAAFGLQAWQLIYPELSAQTKLQTEVSKSSIHYQRHGVEPAQEKPRDVSKPGRCQCAASATGQA